MCSLIHRIDLSTGESVRSGRTNIYIKMSLLQETF